MPGFFPPKALVPDLNRMNPLTGLGRMFSWNSLMELGKAVLKAILIGGVAVLLIWKERDEIFGLLGEPLEAGLAHAGNLVTFSFLILASTLVLVVAADVPFQLWQYFDKLKMTKEEVKQEMKEMMGDPQVKGRIRSLQMQAARKRMMAAVPQAECNRYQPNALRCGALLSGGYGGPQSCGQGRRGDCLEDS
jgi:flagellar biosynthetic protein FlhB